jgi:multidrug efflux pump subunit AcrA (membrane-fusion protein)
MTSSWLNTIVMGSFLASSATCGLGLADSPIIVESPILKTIESTSIPSETAGPLVVCSVQEGSVVTKGSEIGRVRDTSARIQAEKAKVSIELAKKKQSNTIDVRIAEKNIVMARADLQRALDANAKVEGVYPTSEVDRLRFLWERSVLEADRAAYTQKLVEHEVAVAELEYKQAFELWQRHKIFAPCDGVVVAVEKRIGEWVEPGTTILKIVQTNTLRIEGLVSEAEARMLKLKAVATVRFSEEADAKESANENGQATNRKTAKLTFISPEANPVNNQVRVYLELENADQSLRPGSRPSRVEIQPTSKD